MQEIPPKFIEGLKKQLLEQYQKILRYRELRNDEQDEKLRQKYQSEIILRQKNIREVEEEFLNTFFSPTKRRTQDSARSYHTSICGGKFGRGITATH